MKQEKFKVIDFIRMLIKSISENLDSFPKKEYELKNRIKNNSYDILELAYEANSTEFIELKLNLINKMLSKEILFYCQKMPIMRLIKFYYGLKVIKDFKKLMLNRDEKIQEQIIKPRDELIQELHKDNVALHKELARQSKLIDKAETFERERTNIYHSNEKLQETCNMLKEELENTKIDMKVDYQNEIEQLNYQHQKEVRKLKKQIEMLERAFESVKEKIKAFVKWVCRKLSALSEEEVIHRFEMETDIDFNIGSLMKINKDYMKEDEEMER